jgi:hypothetical protein
VSEENLRSVNSPSVTGRSGSVRRSRTGCQEQGCEVSAAAGCHLSCIAAASIVVSCRSELSFRAVEKGAAKSCCGVLASARDVT